MPSYHVDLTPFAGMLGGKHTLSINAANNGDYWLLSGSMFLYENNGKPTKGSVLKVTLTFPTQAPSSTTNVYGSGNNLMSQTANQSYEIEGQIQTGNDTWTSKVSSSLNTSNDQTNVSAGYWQLVHGAQTVTTDDTLTGPGNQRTVRHSEDMYTIDAGSAYMQPSDGSSGFFLPSNLTQTLDEVHSITGPGIGQPYTSTLYETIQGYAALQRGAAPDLAQGSTTAYANFEDSLGKNFRQVLMARGGKVVFNQDGPALQGNNDSGK